MSARSSDRDRCRGCRPAPDPGATATFRSAAHLANAAAAGVCELYYCREDNHEVDFVTRAGRTVTAIEVKSGRSRETRPGLAAFADAFKPTRKLLVGGDGIALEEFLKRPVEHWVRT